MPMETQSSTESRTAAGRRAPGGARISRDERLCDLMEAVRIDRDATAFTDLFHHLAPRIKRVQARHGASAAAAEDLAQEAMLAVWRRAETFDFRRASVATWAITIARNKQIDLLRGAHRRHDVPWAPTAADVPVGDPDPELSLHLAESGKIVRQAVQSLPRAQEQILRKAFDEAKSHRQIAAELGVPLGTVKSRMRLALAHLRATLPLADLR
jgi:RNA polymerase sigma factor (sigma-70 family)